MAFFRAAESTKTPSKEIDSRENQRQVLVPVCVCVYNSRLPSLIKYKGLWSESLLQQHSFAPAKPTQDTSVCIRKKERKKGKLKGREDVHLGQDVVEVIGGFIDGVGMNTLVSGNHHSFIS